MQAINHKMSFFFAIKLEVFVFCACSQRQRIKLCFALIWPKNPSFASFSEKIFFKLVLLAQVLIRIYAYNTSTLKRGNGKRKRNIN